MILDLDRCILRSRYFLFILVCGCSGQAPTSAIVSPEPRSGAAVPAVVLKPTALTPEVNALFGIDVESNGQLIAVGASKSRVSGHESGAVCVFQSSTGKLLRTLLCPKAANEDFFGRTFAIYGNRIAVAAHRANIGIDKGGAVFLFDVETGHLLYTLANPLQRRNNAFATAVALTDDYVIINDLSATTGGAVYVFDVGAGRLLKTLQKHTPAENDEFGASLAAVGEIVVIGAPGDSSSASKAGAAFVYNVRSGALSRKGVRYRYS